MARGMDRLETMPVSPWARPLRWGLRIWAALIVAYLYIPVAFLVLFSFEDSNAVGFPIRGFTLKWYEGLPDNSILIGAIGMSISTAIIVAIVATLVGTMAAFPLVRSGMRFPNVARIGFTMPIMIPGIIIGVGILIFLAGTLHILLSQLTVIAGHLVLTMPFVVLIVSARLQGFDRRLEWAAADLGAGPAQVMRRIVLPLIFPAILAGALISITLSIDEFVVTFWTIGPNLTLPIYIYTQIKFGVTPEVNAVATLVLAFTVLALALAALVAMAFGRVRAWQRSRSGVGLMTGGLADPSVVPGGRE
jgi:spermidine/putrescine transport system permease protein